MCRAAGKSSALAASTDHTASTLWLNPPVSTSFLLAHRERGIVCMAARGECFPDKMKQKNMGGINFRKMFHGSATAFLFLFFLSMLCAFSKGRLAIGSWSVMRALLGVAVRMGPGCISVGCQLL